MIHRHGRLTGAQRRVQLLAALVFSLSLACAPIATTGSAQFQPPGRYYPATGRVLAPQFLAFYDSHGGLPLFGYPITEATTENGYLVQWTERERLEWHPEKKGTPYEVMLGLLGSELVHGLDGPHFVPTGAARSLGAETAGARFFPETGQEVADPFLTYWETHGGLAVFGYPASARYRDESGFDIQWFERARFEYHPEMPDPFKVSLGLLGIEAAKERQLTEYELSVSGTASAEPNLHIDVSQGGESSDPGFLDNVKDEAAQLGPGLLRIDNIFNFYHVVSRAADGSFTYNWTELDREIDAVRALGKEPFICLSYMPEVFSASGQSRVLPPTDYKEWGDLVRATVAHLNVERGLGIRYWEVWNEPNQWDFWRGSFQDYLHLYDVTVEAATGVDPSIHIGGPAFSNFEPDGMKEFVAHEAALGSAGRIDFLSWHSYGQTSDEIAFDIQRARSLLANYPQFKGELVISEFNVLPGGRDDTSLNGYTDTAEGAIALLTSIESMLRERLDRAFLFELKDGQGPTSFWGRWGILTYDAKPKPAFYVLRAYQNRPPGMLPVTMTRGIADGRLGLMAFGDARKSTLLLWYSGGSPARVKIDLPADFAQDKYTVDLFDRSHNNPAMTGHSSLQTGIVRDAGDLRFDLVPGSVLILTSPGH